MSNGPGGVSHGADVAALRATAQELETAAEQLGSAVLAITVRAYRFEWNGPDATRFRGDWDGIHAPGVAAVARALVDAALHLTREAADQEATSSGGGGSAPITTVSASSGPDLQTRLERLRDALIQMPTAASLGEAVAAARHSTSAAPVLGKLDDAMRSLGSGGGTVAKYGGTLLGAAGAVLNVVDGLEGVREGDAAKVVQNGVPLLTTGAAAAGLVGSGTAAAVTVPFALGSLAGNEINDRMEGTAYGDRVTANFETVFDTFGAAGMLLTPVVLAKSGLDLMTSPDGVVGGRADGGAGDGR